MREETAGSSRRRPGRRVLMLATPVLVLGAAAWVGFLIVGDRLRPRRVQPTELSQAGESWNPPGFTGAKACARCHPEEASALARSGHSQTLTRAGQSSVARWFAGKSIADPELQGVVWTYALGADGVLKATRRENGKTLTQSLDYAVGSGHDGVTFVSLEGPPGAIEGQKHRLSYFTEANQARVTPGADPNSQADLSRGEPISAENTLKCFECHSSRTSRDGRHVLDPATLLPGIDCERCHGPGQKHADAVLSGALQSGSSKSEIRYGKGKSGADAEIRMCGECHRHPSSFPPDALSLENPILPQFPAAGLAQSKCFTSTPRGIACTTCHDPHDEVPRDLAGFDRACLKCHDSPGIPGCPKSSGPTGCVTCHMPRRTVPDGFAFYDHWIRIERPTKP